MSLKQGHWLRCLIHIYAKVEIMEVSGPTNKKHAWIRQSPYGGQPPLGALPNVSLSLVVFFFCTADEI